MTEKETFLIKLGYTVEKRTFIDYQDDRYGEFEESYTATVAFKDEPDERYKSGKHLTKEKFRYCPIELSLVYNKEFDRVLKVMVHNYAAKGI